MSTFWVPGFHSSLGGSRGHSGPVSTLVGGLSSGEGVVASGTCLQSETKGVDLATRGKRLSKLS